MARVHGCPKMTPFWTPVNTAREHRRHFTREHGQSRSPGAIVIDVLIISYLQDGCPNDTRVYGPYSWPVNTAREHG